MDTTTDTAPTPDLTPEVGAGCVPPDVLALYDPDGKACPNPYTSGDTIPAQDEVQ